MKHLTILLISFFLQTPTPAQSKFVHHIDTICAKRLLFYKKDTTLISIVDDTTIEVRYQESPKQIRFIGYYSHEPRRLGIYPIRRIDLVYFRKKHDGVCKTETHRIETKPKKPQKKTW